MKTVLSINGVCVCVSFNLAAVSITNQPSLIWLLEKQKKEEKIGSDRWSYLMAIIEIRKTVM